MTSLIRLVFFNNKKDKTKKEQLIELKELLNDGIITQEDFEKKKQM